MVSMLSPDRFTPSADVSHLISVPPGFPGPVVYSECTYCQTHFKKSVSFFTLTDLNFIKIICEAVVLFCCVAWPGE
jgi:hypothetical protein